MEIRAKVYITAADLSFIQRDQEKERLVTYWSGGWVSGANSISTMKTPGTRVAVGVGVWVCVAVGRVPVTVGVLVRVAVMVIVPVEVGVGVRDGVAVAVFS